ncbi:hypothetical protein MNBD_NITROSPINAE02-1056 [hydrothermal vent metagenome]|uniref:Uncharacterized protein n=1 Tax=hydrothermal vent metagenome TaxID=652676 RepID=A0A3B1C5Z2_9ZZZZ
MVAKTSSKEVVADIAVMYVRIARSLRRLGEISLALNVCERGLNKCPKSSNMRIIMGQIQISYYSKENRPGLLKSALINFEKALKLDPQNYIARLLASKIYLKAGARKHAKAYLAQILKISPDDERAKALMEIIREKEKKAKSAKKESKAISDDASLKGRSTKESPQVKPPETTKDEGQWNLDEKVIIGEEEDADDEFIMELLSAKLTMFSRLEGLSAIFLLDKNGQPYRIINKEKLDENIIPSMIFNLFSVSKNAVRRSGFGAIQRGVLISPIGAVIIARAYHSTLAVIVDADTNIANVEKRVDRYLEEVTG